jgi:hypothetical protein
VIFHSYIKEEEEHIKQITERKEKFKSQSDLYCQFVQKSENVITAFHALDQFKKGDLKRERMLNRILQNHSSIDEETEELSQSEEESLELTYSDISEVEGMIRNENIPSYSKEEFLQNLNENDMNGEFLSGEENPYTKQKYIDSYISGEEHNQSINDLDRHESDEEPV